MPAEECGTVECEKQYDLGSSSTTVDSRVTKAFVQHSNYRRVSWEQLKLQPECPVNLAVSPSAITVQEIVDLQHFSLSKDQTILSQDCFTLCGH
jgi:hypothetical protein